MQYLEEMENTEVKEVVELTTLSLVAVKDEDIDISDLPSFSAHKMCVRIVEFDTHLFGTMFGLAYLIDHEDGTYSISNEFPLSMINEVKWELLNELDSISDDYVCWGLPASVLKQAEHEKVLSETQNGYYQ